MALSLNKTERFTEENIFKLIAFCIQFVGNFNARFKQKPVYIIKRKLNNVAKSIQ